MFERTIESQTLHASERRFGTVSVVALAHLTAASFLAVVAALTVRPIHEPGVQPTFVIVAPRPDPPPGPHLMPAAPPAPRRSGHDEPARAAAPPAIPIATPAVLPQPAATPPPEAPDGPPGTPGGGGDGPPGTPRGDPGARGGGGDGGGDGPDGPVALTGEMIPPVRIAKVDPAYPNAARIARMTGTVVVQAIIGLDGRVESTEILASTSPLFDAAAMEAVRQWRYTPATMNGGPVRVYFSVRVEFVLR